MTVFGWRVQTVLRISTLVLKIARLRSAADGFVGGEKGSGVDRLMTFEPGETRDGFAGFLLGKAELVEGL